MKQFDLHNHTIVSKDGATEARKIIDIAVMRGLSGIGICDHDEFPDENLYDYASSKGIKLALGVEFSCQKAHIIGYNMSRINELDKVFLGNKFDELREDYVNVAKTMIKALAETGVDISIEKVQNAFNKKKIQKLFVMKYMAEYLDLGFTNWSDARKWLQRKEEQTQNEAKKTGKDTLPPSFYPKDGSGVRSFDPLEIIELIHRSGGYAIWAHPFITPGDKRKEYLEQFYNYGIDAVEANYAYKENGYKGNETNDELEEVIRGWLIDYNIPVSGGSDSHYPLKTYKNNKPIMPGDFGVTHKEIEKIAFIFK